MKVRSRIHDILFLTKQKTPKNQQTLKQNNNSTTSAKDLHKTERTVDISI